MFYKLLLPLLLSVCLLSACSSDPKDRFAGKKQVGLCQENQGMETFEAFLYEDSTFYQPASGLIEYSFGTYSLSSTGIDFKTDGGTVNLCDSYSYDTYRRFLTPNKGCTGEYLDIFFSDGKHFSD